MQGSRPPGEEGIDPSTTLFHWRERVELYKAHATKLAKWSEKREWIETLVVQPEDYFVPKDSTASNGKCQTTDKGICCSVCNAVAVMEASYESFNKSFQEYKESKKNIDEAKEAQTKAEKAHADAMRKLEDATNAAQLASEENRVADTAALVAYAKERLADKTALVSSAAALVASAAKMAAKDEVSLAEKAVGLVKDAVSLAKDAELVAKAHSEVASNLDALRPAGNDSRVCTASEEKSTDLTTGDETKKRKQANIPGVHRIANPTFTSSLGKLREDSLVDSVDCKFLHPLNDEEKTSLQAFYGQLRVVLFD